MLKFDLSSMAVLISNKQCSLTSPKLSLEHNKTSLFWVCVFNLFSGWNFLFMFQAAALLPSDPGKVFPAVQCNEDGTLSSRPPLGHWPTQRQWPGLSWVCDLQRRTGTYLLLMGLQQDVALTWTGHVALTGFGWWGIISGLEIYK